MNKKLESALKETLDLISEKEKEYANVKGMEKLIEYARNCEAEIRFRQQLNELDKDWLKAVRSDISRTEYICRYEAGLLSPEEAAGRKAIIDFINSKPDLPDDVR